MAELNYHHLFYFWTAARHGGVSAAAKVLYLSQPTISGQLRLLEKTVGGKLFERSGRKLVLTSLGHEILRFADEIFAIGRELEDFIADRPIQAPRRVQIGVVDGLPKIIAYRLIEPSLQLEPAIHVECHDGPKELLLAQLVTHDLDVVLSDSPAHEPYRQQVYHHLLGKCGISFLGRPPLSRLLRRNFPKSLDGAPFLSPARASPFRRDFDRWCDVMGIKVTVKAEVDDSALLKAFGQAGVGFFAVPSVIEKEVSRQYGVSLIGRIDDLKQQFFAISIEKRLRHPAVQAITESARRELFVG